LVEIALVCQLNYGWRNRTCATGSIMTHTISSRTPEGEPAQCPVCNALVCIEPSQPSGDAPCPNCGTLLWLYRSSTATQLYESNTVAPIRDHILQIISNSSGILKERIDLSKSFIENGMDSFDLLDFFFELEHNFEIELSSDAFQEFNKSIGAMVDYLTKRILDRRMQ
jgi:acyl carrier protein